MLKSNGWTFFFKCVFVFKRFFCVVLSFIFIFEVVDIELRVLGVEFFVSRSRIVYDDDLIFFEDVKGAVDDALNMKEVD